MYEFGWQKAMLLCKMEQFFHASAGHCLMTAVNKTTITKTMTSTEQLYNTVANTDVSEFKYIYIYYI